MKRFSKAICLALLVFTMIFALAGCSTAPKQDLGDIVITEPVVEEPAAEPVAEPAAEVPAETPAEPVVEAPVETVAEAPAETVAEEAVVYVPVEKKYTLFSEGDITVVADKGKATITYPAEYITEADIDAAALAAYQGFSSIYDLSEVYYEVNDGVLTLYYPESWGVEELAVAEQTIMEVLPAYVVSVLADNVESVVESAAEAVDAAIAEIDAKAQAIEENGISATISLFGYEATISLKDDVITIDYPDFITVDEIKAAAAAAYEAYSQYLEGSELTIDDGYATLKLSFTIGEDEFYYAVNLLQSELSYYVAEVLGIVADAAEATEETAEVDEDATYAAEIEILGYELGVKAYENVIEITYPSFITFEEIQEAAAAAYEAFPQYLEGSTLYVDTETSTAVLSLAGVPSVEDLSYAVNLVESVLPSYVMSLLADNVEEVVETAAEVIDEAVAEVEETTPTLLQTSFSVLGYEVQIAAYGNQIAVSYPDFITNDVVAAAARSTYEAYSQYFQGSELTIDNGTAVLTLAYNLTEDDFNVGVEALKSELTNYIVGLFTASEEETVEEVTEVAEVVEEPATEEQPAATEEAPATEPAKEETPAAETKTEETKTTTETKTETTTQPAASSTTTTTTTATAEPAKKSNTGLIVLIVVLVVVAAAAVVLFLKKKKN